MVQAYMVGKARLCARSIFTFSFLSLCLLAINAHTALANTYSDSTYSSNRYSGNNSTTTEPTAPLSVTAIPGDKQAIVRFSPPTSNGGALISNYTVTSLPGFITASGISSPIIVSGLENGTLYRFIMTATNSIGTSATSTVSNPIVPEAPNTSSPKRSVPRPRTPGATPPLTNGVRPKPTPSTVQQPSFAPQQTNISGPENRTFVRALESGSTGPDVQQLQKFLNTKGFVVSPAGPGSPGSETALFGPATRAALIKFQQQNGIVPASGYLGPKTISLISALSAGQVPAVPTDPVQNTDTPANLNNNQAFGKDLEVGTRDPEVQQLQKFLNTKGFVVSPAGPGSPGSETALFGPATRAALIKFQQQNGIVPASGYLGPKTRALLNSSILPDTLIESVPTDDPLLIPPAPILPTSSATATTPDPSFEIIRTVSQDLKTGSIGPDVLKLQIFLNSKGFSVASEGPGSQGNETEKFGQGTREALIRFQKANDIIPANGYFGPKTQEFLRTMID